MKHPFWWALAGIIITIAFLAVIVFEDLQTSAISLIRESAYLAPLIIIGSRFLGSVLAPLPGVPIAIASLAILPWWEAWAYNFLGAYLGALGAFLIARFFREPVVAQFVALEKLHEWQARVSATKQFWGFVGLRAAALVAFDFVSYAAGLSKLSFAAFAGATLLVDLPATFLFFYFGGKAFEYGLIIFALFLVAAMILYESLKKIMK